jgi:hypothetical protein
LTRLPGYILEETEAYKTDAASLSQDCDSSMLIHGDKHFTALMILESAARISLSKSPAMNKPVSMITVRDV